LKCIQCLTTPLRFSKGAKVSVREFYSPVTPPSRETCRNGSKWLGGGRHVSDLSKASPCEQRSLAPRRRRSRERAEHQPRSLPRRLLEAVLNHRPRGQLFPLSHLWEGGITTVGEFCSVLRGFKTPGQMEMAKEPRSVRLKESSVSSLTRLWLACSQVAFSRAEGEQRCQRKRGRFISGLGWGQRTHTPFHRATLPTAWF